MELDNLKKDLEIYIANNAIALHLVADEIGISRMTLHRFINGKGIGRISFAKISQFLCRQLR